MGLNRELRTLNQNIATDKQLKQLEKQEKKQLKELEEEVNLYLQDRFLNCFNENFIYYKNQIFKEEFKDKILHELFNIFGKQKNFNYILQNFNKKYIKIANEQMKIYLKFNSSNLILTNEAKLDLEFYIKAKINYLLELDFGKYKNDLFLLDKKEEIKKEYLENKPTKKDIVLIYFDNFYYKILQQQLKMHNQNQKAIDYYIQQQQQQKVQAVQQQLQNIKQKAKSDANGLFWFIFTLVNLINICLAGFKTTKRRF